MNPPYDILKLNRSEFLYPRMNQEQKKSALQEFEQLKSTERRFVRFYRESGQYDWSVDNVINLYRLMIERAIKISSSIAKLGFIVPSTLLCDSSSTKLRTILLGRYRLLGIDEFDEKANIFSGVTQAVCIVRVDKSKSGRIVPLAVHGRGSIDNLGCCYHDLPLDTIKSISGESLSIPKVGHDSWDILEKVHRHPRLGRLEWILNRRGELDLTAHRQYITSDDTGTRLIRGSHIKRYEIRWESKSKEEYVQADAFSDALGQSMKIAHVSLKRIAGQQICNMSQKWRLKFSLIPVGTVLANSCNYLIVQGAEDDETNLFYLLALMNSHLLNWRFKATSTNNHVNNNEIDMLPVPDTSHLSDDDLRVAAQISENARRLSDQFDEDLDWNTEALVFHLYGLSEQEALTVLEYQTASDIEKKAILGKLAELNQQK